MDSGNPLPNLGRGFPLLCQLHQPQTQLQLPSVHSMLGSPLAMVTP